MKINIERARSQFFQNSSLEMVYFEAIANALDAGADSISIDINIDEFILPETLKLTITDNGSGFTDDRFKKFSKLLEVEDLEHKGLGRLVFLNYFKRVMISSSYDGYCRIFTFDDKFDGKNTRGKSEEGKQETILSFDEFYNDKIKTYEYLKPDSLKRSIILHFLPRFYSMRVSGKSLKINISLFTKNHDEIREFFTSEQTITLDDLPNLLELSIDTSLFDFTCSMSLHYSIEKSDKPVTLITAISSDNRTVPIDIITKDCIPVGYAVVFILKSDYFTGRSDNTRQGLNLTTAQLNEIKTLFRKAIKDILAEKIPSINKHNDNVMDTLSDKYPHLSGYFIDDSVGLIDKNECIEKAQSKFFSDQREILETTELDEEKYQKSLILSARLLAEYVLYRSKIINKLKSLDSRNTEAEIHNLIIPKFETFQNPCALDDIYSNNAWLLDDKFMSYSTILSEKDMSELLNAFSMDEQVDKDDKRPDIALVFSKDPSLSTGVDVVIVELKRIGLDLVKKEGVISQLKQRARKLLHYYPHKIQRIWFYGIVDFDPEFLRSLKEEEFIELYSKDTCYYKEHGIIPDYAPEKKIPVGLFVLSYKALFEDAESRNATFLRILKEGLKDCNASTELEIEVIIT